MAQLVLGPLLRYAGETEATVWVETDAPCEVEVLGCRGRTFHVEGHHYALVVVEGLEPGRTHEYEVLLDGARRWPEPGSPFPPSAIRTVAPGDEVTIVFGSCRVALPHEPPYTLTREQDPRGRQHDALHALAQRLRREPPERRPHKLLMLGDQVYVDEGSPRARERIRERRDVRFPPGEEVANFEEYTWLYHEAWGEPSLRWLLSTVATAMVWDDHDMHDDWNISGAWVREMREHAWWRERVRSGIASYWVYQHIGNLSPRELREDETFARVHELEDAGPLLREHARRADREAAGTRWSYCREAGGVRVVAIDSRGGRVLHGTRRRGGHEHGRAMIDDDEWRWVERHVTGDVDHLVVATSLPFLLLPGLHWLEAWSEAVADGAWGRPGRWLGERARRAGDLEAWAAFQDSFHRLAALLADVAAGRRGTPPASIVVVSGDVHHAYLARTAFRRGSGVHTPVYQAVCSPFRNGLSTRDQRVLRFGLSPAGHALARALGRLAGVEEPELRWRLEAGPFFDNQCATLTCAGRSARLAFDKTIPGDAAPDLERVWEGALAPIPRPVGSI